MTSPCTTCVHRIEPIPFPKPTPPRTPNAALELQKARERAVDRMRQEETQARSRGLLPVVETPRYQEYCAKLSKPGAHHLCRWVDEACASYTASNEVPAPERIDTSRRPESPAQGHRGAENADVGHGTPDTQSDPTDVPVVRLGSPLVLVPRTDAETSSARQAVGAAYVDSYDLQPAAKGSLPVCISGTGWYQSYLLFGGPGAGKTYLYMNMLSQMLAPPGVPPPGALILDPKGALQKKITGLAVACGREDDLVILSRDGAQTSGYRTAAVNLFGCTALAPRDLGRVVAEVVLAEAGELAGGWQVFVSDLLESATVIIHHDNAKRVTPYDLARDLLTTTAEGEPPIAARVRRMLSNPHPDVQDAVQRLQSYYGRHTEQKTRQFVRQVIEQTIGELKSERWKFLSDPEGGNVYEDIVTSGRVMLVSIGQASPAFQRSLCSLVKALFQRTVLAREAPDDSEKRFSILACDEYAQVATEGTSGLVSDSAFFSLSREYHCFSLLALQSAATGRSRFPGHLRDRWDAILGNISAKVFMRLNDVETAQMASEHLGERQVMLPIDSTTSGASQYGVTHTLATTQRRAVPHWVLTQKLTTGQGLVIGTLDGGRSVSHQFFLADEKPLDRLPRLP